MRRGVNRTPLYAALGRKMFRMRNRPGCLSITWIRIASLAVFDVFTAAAQNSAYKAPRTADGKPDLNGIWQALNTADWDIQAHASAAGPVPSLAADFAIPPGTGIVEGNEIPYLPAMAERKRSRNSRNALRPIRKSNAICPGCLAPHTCRIRSGLCSRRKQSLVSYEYDGAVRTIDMGKPGPAPVDSWMGWSVGHWEGDTLVVDVTGMNNKTWFDRAGNFHSDQLHVVERYTPRSADTLMYEATIEDPKVFSRPWKISMPLYRHVEKNAQLLEFKCVEFAEELLYGPISETAGGSQIVPRCQFCAIVFELSFLSCIF